LRLYNFDSSLCLSGHARYKKYYLVTKAESLTFSAFVVYNGKTRQPIIVKTNCKKGALWTSLLNIVARENIAQKPLV